MSDINTRIPHIIVIEGNIGAGKSTLINKLNQLFNTNSKVKIIEEPVELWNNIKDKDGTNILTNYYKNQEKYAFSFQIMSFTSRFNILRNALKNNYDIIIIERSMFSDKYIFTKMLYDTNMINEIEYKIYLQLFDEFISEIPEVSIIYLKTDPIVAKKRVDYRNRKGEIISLEYLQECHRYHEEWLNNTSQNIITIDGNKDYYNDETELNDIIQRITEFIKIPCYINNDKIYLLKFDGACSGNPGKCGAGYVIYSDNESICEGYKSVSAYNTSNYAEYMGLIIGLNKAISLGIKNLKIEGDSMLIVNQVTGNFACQAQNLIDLLNKVRELFNSFNLINIDYISRQDNKIADKLAKKGVKECNIELKNSMEIDIRC